MSSIAPAVGPAGKTVTLQSICFSLRRSCMSCMWPGPSTAHMFCHSLWALHFESLPFQIMKALGSLTSGKQMSWHCSEASAWQIHKLCYEPKRTLPQGSVNTVYLIHTLYHGVIAIILKLLAVASRIPRTEILEKLECVLNKQIKYLNFFPQNGKNVFSCSESSRFFSCFQVETKSLFPEFYNFSRVNYLKFPLPPAVKT